MVTTTVQPSLTLYTETTKCLDVQNYILIDVESRSTLFMSVVQF